MPGSIFYQALLRCYPAAFRDEYGGQMQLAFSDQLAEARSTSPIQTAALWAAAARDAVTIGPQEHLHVIFQDVRYALRTLAARPGFAAVAILSLALGIGANTAIFSLWTRLLHAPIPGAQHPEQLVILTDPGNAGAWHGSQTGPRDWMTFPEFDQIRSATRSFSRLMASESVLADWQLRFEGGDWEAVHGRLVSDDYFSFLGVEPALGRVFADTADRADAPYAVLSHSYWQRRFNGRADVLGKTLTIRNATLTVIGVAPPDFIGETAGQLPDLWIPVRMQPAVEPGENRLREAPPVKAMWLHVFARLNPGVSLARAQSETNAIFHAGLEQFYGAGPSPERRRELLDQQLKVRPAGAGASETRGQFSTSLDVLLGAVGLLLLIACANLANLLLARGAIRRPEVALRLSLGASRGRLVRQLLTESLVLAALGGVAGLALAVIVYGALVAMVTRADRDFQMSFALDPSVLAFTLAVTLAAGLLFGLLPAWQATRAHAAAALKESRSTAAGERLHFGRALVCLQIALSLPLLAGAGLLARTIYNLQHIDLGYSVDRLSAIGISPRSAGYDSARSAALFETLRAQIARIPGVSSVTYSNNGIFTGGHSGDPMEVEGYTPKKPGDRASYWEMIGPGYFSTLGIPILAGRPILAADDAAAPRICVINQAFAHAYFKGRNPIGLHVTTLDEEPRGLTRTAYQVVGVSRDARTNDLTGKISPLLYLPTTQPDGDEVKRASFLIRTARADTPALPAGRRIIRNTDATIPIDYARTMEEQLAPFTAVHRAMAQIALAFGSIALALAAIGLYGVLSYNVARRRNEIAVRIALGAHPSRVIAMVMRETGAMILAGLVIGAGLTYEALHWIESQLYGVTPQDPLTLSLAAGALVLVALAAVYAPARRAAHLDPIVALRQE